MVDVIIVRLLCKLQTFNLLPALRSEFVKPHQEAAGMMIIIKRVIANSELIH